MLHSSSFHSQNCATCCPWSGQETSWWDQEWVAPTLAWLPASGSSGSPCQRTRRCGPRELLAADGKRLANLECFPRDVGKNCRRILEFRPRSSPGKSDPLSMFLM